MSKYEGLGNNLVFAEEEQKTLAYWDEIDAFKKSLELSKGKPEYTFYDGPPFATGMPHYGYVSRLCLLFFRDRHLQLANFLLFCISLGLSC
jgi:isoleucyl-tRNA synthetase